MIVGIAEMPTAWARSCSASVSILPNTTSVCFSAAFSNTGANILQGPHHSAQKSSSTMPGFSTISWKLSMVIWTVLVPMRRPLGRRCVMPE